MLQAVATVEYNLIIPLAEDDGGLMWNKSNIQNSYNEQIKCRTVTICGEVLQG